MRRLTFLAHVLLHVHVDTCARICACACAHAYGHTREAGNIQATCCKDVCPYAASWMRACSCRSYEEQQWRVCRHCSIGLTACRADVRAQGRALSALLTRQQQNQSCCRQAFGPQLSLSGWPGSVIAESGMHIFRDTRAHTHTHTRTSGWPGSVIAESGMHIFRDARTHTRAHAHTRKHTRAHTHTHTHTHTRSMWQALSTPPPTRVGIEGHQATLVSVCCGWSIDALGKTAQWAPTRSGSRVHLLGGKGASNIGSIHQRRSEFDGATRLYTCMGGRERQGWHQGGWSLMGCEFRLVTHHAYAGPCYSPQALHPSTPSRLGSFRPAAPDCAHALTSRITRLWNSCDLHNR